MSNTNAPYGFRPIGRIEGSAPNFGLAHYWINPANTSAIYRGDPVFLGISGQTGYVDVGTAGSEAILGIFWGCHYNSIARKMPVWSPYYPGSDALTGINVDAYVIVDPNAEFVVQTDGTAAITQGSVGNLAQMVVGSGSTTTGLSGYTLSHTTGSTTTYPFRLIGLLSDIAPPGTNGTDNTNPYNQVIVGFNNQLFRTTAAP